MELLDENDQRLVAALVDDAGTLLKMAREPGAVDPEAKFDRATDMLSFANVLFLMGEVDREAAIGLLSRPTRGTWFGY
jgi:hypothetical protein